MFSWAKDRQPFWQLMAIKSICPSEDWKRRLSNVLELDTLPMLARKKKHHGNITKCFSRKKFGLGPEFTGKTIEVNQGGLPWSNGERACSVTKESWVSNPAYSFFLLTFRLWRAAGDTKINTSQKFNRSTQKRSIAHWRERRKMTRLKLGQSG